MRQAAERPTVLDAPTSGVLARPSRHPFLLAVLAIGAVLLSACTGAGGARSSTDAALEERLVALEDRLATLEAGADVDDPAAATPTPDAMQDGRLDDVAVAVDALAARIDALAQDLGDEGATRALSDAETIAAVRELEQRQRTLVAELDALRAQVESLTARVDRIATR